MLIYSASELEEYWRYSTRFLPTVIIGGGRWGRVWANVISQCRGSGGEIIIVARNNFDDTVDWVRFKSGFPEINVVQSFSDVGNIFNVAGIAIVASRPSDHINDAVQAMNCGYDVLIEKPICPKAKDGSKLKYYMKKNKSKMAINTEYMLLPAFHYCADRIFTQGANISSVDLYWDDPIHEHRYGSIKNIHGEIGVLVDLIPHASSIFRIFSKDNSLKLTECYENKLGRNGWAKFIDQSGCVYKFYCDQNSTIRRRIINIGSDKSTALIDFRTNQPLVTIDGINEFPDRYMRLNSTLRLMFGKFIKFRSCFEDDNVFNDIFNQLIDLQINIENEISYS